MKSRFSVGVLCSIVCLVLLNGIGLAAVTPDIGAFARTLDIPRLNWEPRSDWMNVTQFGAQGDGVADDTAAIQAVYNKLGKAGQPRVAYFPPGTYRITDTLTITGDIAGLLIIGHGRDTVLVWDGPQGGSMFWSNGVHRTRYEGLTYDGRGKAGIGSEHRSMTRYETHIIYQHCAFKNLEYGIAVSKNPRKQASAEIWYNNVLFKNCGTGALFNAYNDYDHWFTGCAFVDSGIGIHSSIGHFNAYNCHFIRSKTADVRMGKPCHPPSVRWCTSTGSRRFLETGGNGIIGQSFPEGAGWHQPIALQGNRIDNWQDPEGAIHLTQRGPNLFFDNVFVNPPANTPPIRLINPANSQQLMILSNNRSAQTAQLIDNGPDSRTTAIPAGGRSALPADGPAWCFRSTADVSGKVFDVKRDFGARGDGRTDDTQAIQRAIDAARAHGKGAVAYLPYGRYNISRTLQVTGADYAIESTGCGAGLNWVGAAEGPMMLVTDPKHVRIEHMEMGGPDTVTRIRQISQGQPSAIYYNNLHVPNVYSKTPGIEMVNLPANAVVRMGFVVGYVRAIDSGQATVLGQIHLGRLQVEGATLPKTGFFGFVYHNTAIHEYVVIVKDNQDVVIGDLYNESNDRFLLAEGGTRTGAGRITIGLSKSSTHDADTVHINNYEGRIWMSSGGWQNQKNAVGGDLTLRQRGTRPVDLLLAGCIYWNKEAQIDAETGLRFYRIENLLFSNDYPKMGKASLPNSIPSENLTPAIAALDDFRQLGDVHTTLFYGER